MKADLQPEISFGDYFTYFQLCWNLCHRREMINPIEFFIYTKALYSWFDSQWEKNKWDKRQLLWICYNIEIGNELVDPINFIEQDFAYLNHMKNCYYIVNIS